MICLAIVLLSAATGFALGYVFCRRSMQAKINELGANVEAGKDKVQSAVDANK